MNELASLPDERPWLASYAPGVPYEIDVPHESLVGMLEHSVERFGRLVALDFFGAETTYAELGEQVSRGAEVLRRLGVKPGDRVAIMVPNCPQHVVAFYSVLRLGAIVVEHNPLYTPTELAQQFADHGARVAVCWDKRVPDLLALRDRTAIETVIAVDMTRALSPGKRLALRLPVRKAREMRAVMTGPLPRDVPRWESLISTTPTISESEPRPAPEDTALIQYTGGTTGVPKGAILTHRNLRANTVQGRAWIPEFKEGGETVFAVLPLFHVYGLTLCLSFSISVGARLVLLPRFDVNQTLDEIHRRPPTLLPAVPPIYDRLADAAVERGESLSSIRFAVSGAMTLPPPIVDKWEAITGGLLVEGYGLTETSPLVLGNPIAPTRRPGTVGIPFPSTEIRIVDRDDVSRVLPAGEEGELLIRGPQVFPGYWNRPEETAAALLPDGWLRTGDVAVADADGFVRIIDRIKELIITGGFNVYPSEVEDVLRRLPEVKDAAVVGMPSESGEEVVAAILPAPGASVDPQEVRAFARKHLTAYKVPRRVVLVDELPSSLIGKVLRREVRDRIMAATPD